MSVETQLSLSTTVIEYQKMLEDNDKNAIADFISNRFNERYLLPFDDNSKKNGFSMMAVSCLMIEALESFRQGRQNSKGKSKCVFNSFFNRSSYFSDFSDHKGDFYKHIRCGLLHQAETTGGWKITRKGNQLVDLDNRVIDATIFMEKLELEIKSYVKELKSSAWDSDIWKKTRSKLKHIIQQCDV